MIFHAKSTHINNKGLTLAELLVASAMIGIVMIGVASFSIAINNLQRSTNKTVIISLKAKTAMARITKDASQAIGDESDRGVIGFTHISGRASICFRHDTDNDPSTYTGDTWACYFQPSGANKPLDYCGIFPFASGDIPPENNGDCNAGSVRKTILELDNTAAVFFQIVEDASTGQFLYVEFTLSTIYDPLLPAHSITNPQYVVTTQISPIGHSR